MTQLVACIGEGKGTWTYIGKLIQSASWDRVFLVTNQFGKDKFPAGSNIEFVLIDGNKTTAELVNDIKANLDGKLGGDVAINLISGSGKEHMALLAALLQLGVGIRLVILTPEGIKEI